MVTINLNGYTRTDARVYNNKFSEYKLFEEEYSVLWSRIHEWDKNDIHDLRLALVDSMAYFKALPIVEHSMNTFFELFEIKEDVFLFKESMAAKDIRELIFAMDVKGRCLLVKDSENRPGMKVIHISELRKMYGQ